MLKQHPGSRDGRAAHLCLLETLDTAYHGAVGRAVVLQAGGVPNKTASEPATRPRLRLEHDPTGAASSQTALSTNTASVCTALV